MRKRSRPTLAVAIVLAVAATLALAACGTKATGNTGTATNTGTPVKGGTLVVTFQGDPTGLDPAIAWEVVFEPHRTRHLPDAHHLRRHQRLGRHETRTGSGHPGAHGSQRRHHPGRPRLHLPHQEGHGVRTAREPRRHGAGLQVQHRAHAQIASRSCHLLPHGHHGSPGLHGRQGRARDGHQGGRPLHAADHPGQAERGVHLHHGAHVHISRAQGVGRQGGQADQPQAPGQRPVHHHQVGAGRGDRLQAQPQLAPRQAAVAERDRLPVLVQPQYGAAQAGARRRRRDGRHRFAGRLPAHQGRPHLEQVHGGGAADRLHLRLRGTCR